LSHSLPRLVHRDARRSPRLSLRAAALWARLDRLPQADRLDLVHRSSEFHDLVLFDLLLEVAEEELHLFPFLALGVIEVALAVLSHLEPPAYSREILEDAKGVALTSFANACRLTCDFDHSLRALRLAEDSLAEGSKEPLLQARVYSVEGELLKDLGQFEQATSILTTAVQTLRGVGDPASTARSLVQLSDVVGHLNPDRGIALCREAIPWIEPAVEPRLLLAAHHNLAWFLNAAGFSADALSLLDCNRARYREFPDASARLHMRWLEAKIAFGLGAFREAQDLLQILSGEFYLRLHYHEYVLVAIDLTASHVALSKKSRASRLVEEVEDVLARCSMHAQGLETWRRLEDAIEARDLGAFRQASLYFRRAWRCPLSSSS